MNLPATIQTIERLKKELNALRPLKQEDEERLWKKFRLEWSYNSNHIEGNTLTYGETELLLIFGKTTGDHTLREYEEMKAHDTAVAWLKELATESDDRMSEMFIRQLNEIILKEPYYKAGETFEGAPAPKQIIPGQYKSSRNSVRLANGEMFHYASPEETPAKMGDLVQWYREVIENTDLHPVQIAAELHYRFVLIHPFDDGNGRVARLLMNYALMRTGYPPIIIPTKDKKAYLDALNKVDTKVDMQAFADYIAKQLVWSLELNVKAAKGEDIEEEDDWEKKHTLFEKKALANKLLPSVTNEIFKQFYHEGYRLFLTHLKKLVEEKFGNLFHKIDFDTNVPTKTTNNPIEQLDGLIGLDLVASKVKAKTGGVYQWKPIENITLNIKLLVIRIPDVGNFDYFINVTLFAKPTTYSIVVNGGELFNGNYGTVFTEEVAVKLAKQVTRKASEEIQNLVASPPSES